MKSPIRAVVVDDSALMRRMISRFLEDAGIEVAATAKDGETGLEAVLRHRPDVVTLDVEMPRMDGLEMLRRLMKLAPTPVVMVSSLTRAQAPAAVEALALGAVDVVAKPGGAISLDLDAIQDEIVRKVRIAAGARNVGLGSRAGRRGRSRKRGLARTGDHAHCIVVVGSSTGGPSSLARFVPRLPADFPTPIVLVQHMPEGFTASLAERLDALSPLYVREAVDGKAPSPGEVWLARAGYHLRFDRGCRMRLDRDPPHLGVRPAVDYTLESAAEVWSGRVVGVILTGMGVDGARGARMVKRAGGVILAQDEASSVVYGMPRAVAEMGLADRVCSLDDMADALCRALSTLLKQGGTV